MVAQVDEQQTAVIALAMHPAGQAGRAAGIGWREARRRCGCGRRASSVRPRIEEGRAHKPSARCGVKVAGLGELKTEKRRQPGVYFVHHRHWCGTTISMPRASRSTLLT